MSPTAILARFHAIVQLVVTVETQHVTLLDFLQHLRPAVPQRGRHVKRFRFRVAVVKCQRSGMPFAALAAPGVPQVANKPCTALTVPSQVFLVVPPRLPLPGIRLPPPALVVSLILPPTRRTPIATISFHPLVCAARGARHAATMGLSNHDNIRTSGTAPYSGFRYSVRRTGRTSCEQP